MDGVRGGLGFYRRLLIRFEGGVWGDCLSSFKLFWSGDRRGDEERVVSVGSGLRFCSWHCGGLPRLPLAVGSGWGSITRLATVAAVSRRHGSWGAGSRVCFRGACSFVRKLVTLVCLLAPVVLVRLRGLVSLCAG